MLHRGPVRPQGRFVIVDQHVDGSRSLGEFGDCAVGAQVTGDVLCPAATIHDRCDHVASLIGLETVDEHFGPLVREHAGDPGAGAAVAGGNQHPTSVEPQIHGVNAS